jgi:hypothetical protein
MSAAEERAARIRTAYVYVTMADEFRDEGNLAKEQLYRAMAQKQLGLS